MKAVLMLSGGLDSTLAAKIMKEQKIELFAVNFTSPFCTCTRKGCLSEARRVAEALDIPLKIISVGNEYIRIIKNPRYGYGKNMNPCIDCRIFMFSKAKTIMDETEARFIVTGEVLGERPMSQRLWAMKRIERDSGLEGLVFRPLSAKLFKPSIPEEMGWVNREEFLAIQGRNRKPQIALAEELDVGDYPCPAGGCRLTDPNFARRLRDLFNHGEDSITDIQLLKFGRHFRLPSGAKAIVGRNELENNHIESSAPSNGLLIECAEDVEGPTTFLSKFDDEDINYAGGLTLRYSDYSGDEGRIRVFKKGKMDITIRKVLVVGELDSAKYRI